MQQDTVYRLTVAVPVPLRLVDGAPAAGDDNPVSTGCYVRVVFPEDFYIEESKFDYFAQGAGNSPNRIADDSG